MFDEDVEWFRLSRLRPKAHVSQAMKKLPEIEPLASRHIVDDRSVTHGFSL